jgi:hypothetical protein
MYVDKYVCPGMVYALNFVYMYERFYISTGKFLSLNTNRLQEK